MASPSGYTPNVFAAGGPVAATAQRASALRSYAPNAFGGSTRSGTVGPLAPHLSRDPSLDPDYLQVYRGLKTDENVPADQKLDIDYAWRMTPNSPIFKPGYTHNPYVEQQVTALREERERQRLLAEAAANPRPDRDTGD